MSNGNQNAMLQSIKISETCAEMMDLHQTSLLQILHGMSCVKAAGRQDNFFDRNQDGAQLHQVREVSDGPAALGVRDRVHFGPGRKSLRPVAAGGQRAEELAHRRRPVV